MSKSYSENFSDRSDRNLMPENIQQKLLNMRRQMNLLRNRLQNEQQLLAQEKNWVNEYSIYQLPNAKDVDRRFMGDAFHPDPLLQIYPNPEVSSPTSSRFNISGKHITSQSSPTIVVRKEYLEDIQTKCDQELCKLENYIENIKELKNNWINMQYLKESCNKQYEDV